MTRFATHPFGWRIYLVGAFILFGIEATEICPEESVLRAMAGSAWLLISGLILITAFFRTLLPFIESTFWSAQDRNWYLVAYFLPVILVLFDIDGVTYTMINTESTQQIGDILALVHERSDCGIFSMAFLGGAYPARQYLLAALPTLLFGKGLVTLRIGYGALYLIGYLSFLSALRAYLKNMNSAYPELISSFAAMMIALGNYPLLFARIFEQTIVPLSLTLFFLAGLLFFLVRPSPFPALCIMWSLGLMPYSYTPSLAFWTLAMILLAYFCRPYTKTRTAILSASMVYGLVTLTTSLFMRRTNSNLTQFLAVGTDTKLNASDWLYRFLDGLDATFGFGDSLIPAPLVFGCLIILYISLRQRDYRFLLLISWAVASLIAALAMSGFCWRPPIYDVHRAMIILPPISAAFALYLAGYWPRFVTTQNEALVRVPLILSLVLMILGAIYLPFFYRFPRPFIPGPVTDTEEATLLVIRDASPNPKRLYLIPPFDCRLEDTFRYFSPDTEIIRDTPPPGDHQPGSYSLSYITNDPVAHDWNASTHHSQPRPYLQIKPE